MKFFNKPVLSAKIIQEKIIMLIRGESELFLYSFDENLDDGRKLLTFRGNIGFILEAFDKFYVLSIDDKLIVVKSRKKDVVFKTKVSGNFFWHSTWNGDELYVQEYGIPPTGIYVSENYRDWRLLNTNLQLDKRSKHFHSLAYDNYRKWLIVTLGDYAWRNRNRCCIYDENGKWRLLYRGPWQFVPIFTLKDRIVFGMDSGIARGGVAIFYPKSAWNFTFLRWIDIRVRFAQMCDLKLLENNIWIAALGCPQAIIISEDLRIWYLLHVDGFDENFNFHMSISEGEDLVTCTTGNRLLVIRKSELENTVSQSQPIMREYTAYTDRLKASRLVLPFAKHATVFLKKIKTKRRF